MATIVNNPPVVERRNNGFGFLIGVLLFILFAVLFFYYAVPGILSSIRSQAPQVNIPSNINVHVDTNK